MSNVNDLLAKRAQRCIAIVLSVKEDEVDAYLTSEASRKLRKVILDQFNDLANYADELLAQDRPVANDAYLAKLEQVHADVRRLIPS